MTSSPERVDLQLYTPRETASILNVSLAQLSRLRKAGEIRSVVVGQRSRRFSAAAIAEYVERQAARGDYIDVEDGLGIDEIPTVALEAGSEQAGAETAARARRGGRGGGFAR